ncbi:hypothetical protein AVEN_202700-1 [Araneus ventricosus]|uniref:Uncharacterized protein n=1 Tax=Araneus ventricosus TaxID=182803 RepID=A0A4Y2U197_ARAVE|nr:hypothetical protein AVEN_202700-1 [Araneus ventricosus]
MRYVLDKSVTMQTVGEIISGFKCIVSSWLVNTQLRFCSDFFPISGEMRSKSSANWVSGIAARREVRVQCPTAMNALQVAVLRVCRYGLSDSNRKCAQGLR